MAYRGTLEPSASNSSEEYLLKDSLFLGSHGNPMAHAMWVPWLINQNLWPKMAGLQSVNVIIPKYQFIFCESGSILYISILFQTSIGEMNNLQEPST